MRLCAFWLLPNKTQTVKRIKCLFCRPELLVFVYANAENKSDESETKILSIQRQRHMWATDIDRPLFANGLNIINLIDVKEKKTSRDIKIYFAKNIRPAIAASGCAIKNLFLLPISDQILTFLYVQHNRCHCVTPSMCRLSHSTRRQSNRLRHRYYHNGVV